MNPETRQAVLHRIEQEWQTRFLLARPWGIWIVEFESLSPGAADIDLSKRLVAAWFLDRRGVRPRGVWEFARFYTVRFDQPWCKRPCGEPLDYQDHVYPIAVACFAPYGGTEDLYLDIQWGPRDGNGYRLKFE